MTLSQREKTKLRTWVELDKGAIKKNYLMFKRMLRGDCILMAVVKSNAFGHGLVPFTKEVVKQGIKFLGVDSFDEALELRNAGIKVKIMVFGYVSPAYYKEAAEKNISITISNFPALEALRKIRAKNRIKIHVKADTGLGRQGFLIADMPKVLKLLAAMRADGKYIEVEGLYSHLAVGENPEGRSFTMNQAKMLNIWEAEFKKQGYSPLIHICATSSTMLYPELHFDMVRVGIGLYGLWPSFETKQAVGRKFKLYPVLSWKTIITELKRLPRGARVGYDLTEKLRRDSLLGVIPVGYWHGYPRLLSGKGLMSVKGKKVKLVGRVSMDMITLDLTGVKVKIADEVAIIGGDYGHYAEADMMAQDSDTINYEITTRINPIIKRFYRINPLIKRFIK
jgi:alanine racemase